MLNDFHFFSNEKKRKNNSKYSTCNDLVVLMRYISHKILFYFRKKKGYVLDMVVIQCTMKI